MNQEPLIVDMCKPQESAKILTRAPLVVQKSMVLRN
jgi:hypothetical protein